MQRKRVAQGQLPPDNRISQIARIVRRAIREITLSSGS